jgi:hypothetical protein
MYKTKNKEGRKLYFFLGGGRKIKLSISFSVACFYFEIEMAYNISHGTI